MCNISCFSFYLYMCIGVILTVVSFSFTSVLVLYWLFFPLVLHVHICNISCSSFQFYMCIGLILAILPLSFTCV